MGKRHSSEQLVRKLRQAEAKLEEKRIELGTGSRSGRCGC
jgi:hypothetical protein